jgi:hypothetical protein
VLASATACPAEDADDVLRGGASTGLKERPDGLRTGAFESMKLPVFLEPI